jgi:glycosyltransferase involved in cell wall biosynthesis
VIYNATSVDLAPGTAPYFTTQDPRPLVYLGTCHPEKGVVIAHEKLRHRDYRFVVTGGRPIPGFTVPRLELTGAEYAQVLAQSDVAVMMSTFPEGWCRAAAEAMALGTPVVGSGAGGMRELLEGGDQIICDSFADLDTAVEHALLHQGELGAKGRRFMSTFDAATFRQEWSELATALAGKR